MEKKSKHEAILVRFLEKYAQYIPVNLPNTQNKIIVDTVHQQYLLVRVGWLVTRFVHDLIFHFEIAEDGKVWIFANWTDMDITEDWIEQGMLKSDIVLGFHSESIRPYTGFACA